MDSLGQFVLFIVIVQVIHSNADNYCYNTDVYRPQNKHFGTKTAYPIEYGNNSLTYQIPGCVPIKIWLLHRHGTRNPKLKDLKNHERLHRLKSKLSKTNAMCDKDFSGLKNWSYDPTIIPEALNERGWTELRHLGWFYRKNFPSLFRRYTDETYLFLYTDTNRTISSYQAFVEGVFGPEAYKTIDAKIDEALLNPSQKSKLYNKNTKFAKSKKGERHKFIISSEVNKMVRKIKKRLGLKKDLKFTQAYAMWMTCALQQAAMADSPWCAAFEADHFGIFEYMSDIRDYWKESYGNKAVNAKLPCHLVKDMLNSMAYTDGPIKVAAYFSHSTTLFMFLTALGANEDAVPLRANNFAQQRYRKFQSSKMVPFGGNFAAIRYQCPTSFLDRESAEKVLFLNNQKRLSVPWCKNGNDGVCTVAEIREMYENSPMHGCDSRRENGSERTKMSALLVGVICVLVRIVV